MKKLKLNNYDSISSLLVALVFLVLGVILLTNPGGIVKFLSYVISSIIVIFGIIKIVSYVIYQKVNTAVDSKKLISGILLVIFGVLSIFFAKSIEIGMRIVVGVWILFVGINRLSISLKLKGDKKVFLGTLITSLVMIISGIYMIFMANLIIQVIGVFMIVYAISEIVGYIFYSKTKGNENEVIVKNITYERKK